MAVLVAAGASVVPLLTRAADLTVDQASGINPFNYTAGTTAYDTVRVGVSSTGTATLSGGSLTANTALFLGVNAGGNGTLTLSNTGLLTVIGATTVGRAGVGTFTQSGGTATLGGGLLLSSLAGGSGTYNLNGGTLSTAFVNGVAGGGTNGPFNFNGGTLQARANSTTYLQGITTANVRNAAAVIDTNGFNVTIAQPLRHSTISGDAAKDGGLTKTGNGTLTLTGSNTFTGNVNVNSGTLAITAGTTGGTNTFFYLDSPSPGGATPAATLSGTAVLTTQYLWAGYRYTGAFTQSGGTLNTSLLSVGRTDLLNPAPSNGTYAMSGGTIQSGLTDIGDRGTGTFTQTGGTHNTPTLHLGLDTGTGTYALSGTGQLAVGGISYVGFGGTGVFNQSGGTHTTGGLLVGFAGSGGTYTLSGNGQLTVNGNTTVGRSGPGTFTQTGGTHQAVNLLVGNEAAGTYNLGNTGVLTVTGITAVGSASPSTFAQTGGTHTTPTLQIGSAGQTGTYSLSGNGQLNVSGNVFVGYGGNGTVNQAGGANNVTGILYLGFPGLASAATTGNGTYTLSGGTLSTGETQVANQGTGTFNQTGGTHTTPRFFMGFNGAAGLYTLSGNGQLNVNGNAVVGFNGPATFTQSGGTATVSNFLYVSASTGGFGTVNLNGGTLTADGVLGNTGGGANAILQFNGGTLKAGANNVNFLQTLTLTTVRNNGVIIDSGGFAVTIANSLLHSTSGADAAVDGGLTKTGNGTLTLTAVNGYTGNTTVTVGTLAIMAGSVGVLNSTAALTLDGPSASAATASLGGTATLGENVAYVGRAGAGTFNQSGGTHLVTTTLYLGFPTGTAPVAASNGTYALSGGTLTSNETQIGNRGTGTFNQTGGSHQTNQVLIGLNGTSGSYNLSATGQLNVNGALGVGFAGLGTFTQAGGTVTTNGSLLLAVTAGSAGTYNLNNGTISVPAVLGNANGGTNSTFNFNGGTLRPRTNSTTFFGGVNAANVRNGGARIDTNGFNVTIGQVLQHSAISGDAAADGGLTKLGNGTLALTGANTYTGPTTVSAGILQVKYAATGVSAASPLLSGVGGANVQGGRLVFDYTGSPTPVATIRVLLAASFAAAATPGVIDSGQLRSSTATLARGLGYADNGIGQVTLQPALFGDADLDGGVSINDFNALAGNFGQASGRFWTQGDFDYDGGVSINDFNLLAASFGQTLPVTSAMWAGLLSFAAAHHDLAAFEAVTGVPEPTAFVLLGITVPALRRRCVRCVG